MGTSSMRGWDAVIIGGGHNGLVCAAYLARAADLEPKDAGLAAELAVARIRSGDSKTARADLERALKLKPDDVTALTTRGELKLQDKDLALMDSLNMEPGAITVTPDGLSVALVQKPVAPR